MMLRSAGARGCRTLSLRPAAASSPSAAHIQPSVSPRQPLYLLLHWPQHLDHQQQLHCNQQGQACLGLLLKLLPALLVLMLLALWRQLQWRVGEPVSLPISHCSAVNRSADTLRAEGSAAAAGCHAHYACPPAVELSLPTLICLISRHPGLLSWQINGDFFFSKCANSIDQNEGGCSECGIRIIQPYVSSAFLNGLGM